MRLSIEDYNAFLMKIMRDHFPEIYERILQEDEYTPLTGRNISMSTNELLSFYMLLCDILKLDIRISDVYSFWSIDSIARMLMKMEDSIQHKIRRELEERAVLV